MNRLRRLGRRGSLLWVLLFGVSGTATASQWAASHAARAPAERAASRVSDAAPTLDLLRGIPQRGPELGDPRARVELVEFADAQCPHCAFANAALLPPIIERYVRSGQLKITLRQLDFLGPRSAAEARFAAAMGLQGYFWQTFELELQRQGPEGSGYANDDFLRRTGEAVPGADVDAAMAARGAPEVSRELDEAARAADRLGVQGTPEFFLVRAGEPPKRLDLTDLSPQAFAREMAPAEGAVSSSSRASRLP